MKLGVLSLCTTAALLLVHSESALAFGEQFANYECEAWSLPGEPEEDWYWDCRITGYFTLRHNFVSLRPRESVSPGRVGAGQATSTLVASVASTQADTCGSTARPVVISNGQKFLAELDFANGGDYPFGLGRMYLSRNTLTGAFGSKWTSTLDYGLIFEHGTAQCTATLTASTTCDTSLTGLTELLVRRPGGGVASLTESSGFWTSADGKLEAERVGTDWVVVTHDGVIETYSAGGQLKTTRDEAHVGLNFNYDGTGKLASVSHTTGRSIGLTWTGQKVTQVRDAANKIYTYSYNGSGYLAGVTSPDSLGQTTYHYEVTGKPWLLTGKSVDGVRKTRYAYLSDERVSQSGDEGGGHQSTFVYSANQTVVTNALGHSSTYQFDAGGHLTSINRPATAACAASSRTSAYNANGKIELDVDGRGNRRRFTYTPLGNIATILSGETSTGSTAKQQVTQYVWNSGETRIDAVREYGASISTGTFIRESVFAFYPDGDAYERDRLLKSITVYDRQATAAPARTTSFNYTFQPSRQIATMTVDGPLAGAVDTTVLSYDAQGNLLTHTNALGHTTGYSNYSALGHPGRVTDPNGLITDYTYDAKGRTKTVTVRASTGDRVSIYDYDADGNIAAFTDPSGRKTTARYNLAGELTQVVAPAAVPLGQDSKDIINLVYNNLGNLRYQETLQSYLKYQIVGYSGGEPIMDWVVNSKEFSGREWSYDANGFLTSELGNNGQNIRNNYDSAGDLSTTIDSMNHVTALGYDSHGRVASTTYPNSGVANFEYNALGWVTKVTDPGGRATTYSYNGHGDLIKIVSPDTGTTNIARDAAGRISILTRSDGTTTTYVLDGLGRVTQQSATWAAYNGIAGSKVHTFTYDSCAFGKGRLCSVSDPTGTVTYTYLNSGEVQSQSAVISGVAYLLSYTYDAVGRLSTATHPTGLVLRYSYTADHRVARIEANIAGVWSNVIVGAKYQPFAGPLIGLSYGNGWNRQIDIDLDGRVSKIYGAGTTHPQSLTVGYNANNLITGLTNAKNPGASQTFGYDSTRNLTLATSTSSGQHSWGYDGVGNRTTHTWGGGTDTYTLAPATNRIASLSGPRARTYTYDPLGNIRFETRGGVTVEKRFDGFNRQVQLIRPGVQALAQPNGATVSLGAGTWNYGYNAFGHRVSKAQSGGLTTKYVYGPDGQLVGETNPGSDAIGTIYVWLEGKVVGIVRANQIFAVHGDQLGRPEVVTNASKTIVWRATNYAFDRLVTVDSFGGLNLGLPGQQYDAEAGTWSNWYRNYDASTGNYSQSDPLGLKAGFATYAYVNANPVNLIDPLGLKPLSDCEKALLAEFIPQEDLDRADIRDGVVPRYLPDNMEGITRGRRIFLRPGVYEPGTAAGIALLAHELVHVGQYREGMTWISYLWSVRRGYNENSKYEQPAYDMQRQVLANLTDAEVQCTCGN